MTTVVNNPQIVPRPPASLPALRAADQGVASALESVLSDNTRRVYQTQWKLFDEWCGEMGLRSLPADPLPVAAAIDRVVHHSVILEFDVPSYRTDAAQQRGQAEEVNRQN